MRHLLFALALLAGCSQPALEVAADPVAETKSVDAPPPAAQPVSSTPMNDLDSSEPDSTDTDGFDVVKTEEEWREQLSPEAFYVTRLAGTERPGTGKYEHETRAGTYKCICCDNPLFRSDAKFDSGCGWPAFFEPLEGANLIELEDRSHGMVRTEVRCGKCDAHLGHVFFGERHAPGGVRYCINSVALDLEADEG